MQSGANLQAVAVEDFVDVGGGLSIVPPTTALTGPIDNAIFLSIDVTTMSSFKPAATPEENSIGIKLGGSATFAGATVKVYLLDKDSTATATKYVVSGDVVLDNGVTTEILVKTGSDNTKFVSGVDFDGEDLKRIVVVATGAWTTGFTCGTTFHVSGKNTNTNVVADDINGPAIDPVIGTPCGKHLSVGLGGRECFKPVF